MRIAEAARLSGLSAHLIRLYERHGVVTLPEREANRYRVYSSADIVVLRLVKRLRQFGVPLAEIRQVLRAAESETCAAVQARLFQTVEEAVAETERRLDELTSLRAQLESTRTGLSQIRASASLTSSIEDCSCVRVVVQATRERTLARDR